MDKLVTALAKLDADDLAVIADEFFNRVEHCLAGGMDGWAEVYAAIACAAIDALNSK